LPYAWRSAEASGTFANVPDRLLIVSECTDIYDYVERDPARFAPLPAPTPVALPVIA
jgi:hypothetical protein